MNIANATIEGARDGIETAILLAMHAKARRAPRRVNGKASKDGFGLTVAAMDEFCPRRAEFPRDMLAADISRNDRLYTTSLDAVVVSPEMAIGRGLEVGMLCQDGRLKWSKIVPMPAPRGLVALSNRPVRWFAYHYREIVEGRPDFYVRRPMPLSDGRVPLMKALGWKGLNAKQEVNDLEEQLAITLSVFEDAHRSGALLATVEEAVRMTFPVAPEAYKSFFALRDGLRETPTGRRNPILHWCAEHIRRYDGGATTVTGHDRGRAELVHGGMRLTLDRAGGYGAFLEQNEPKT